MSNAIGTCNNYNGFIYTTINLINNKRYIGSHFGKDDDGYIGSGKLLLKAIKKYGKANFKRIILLYCNVKNRNELYKQEELFLKKLKVSKKELYYNINSKCHGPEKGFCRHSGKNHYSFKGYYHTPAGVFTSMQQAAIANNCAIGTILKRSNNKKEKFNEWYFEPKGE